ncbi:hypothetical protein LJK87_11065 [Paenibacillus sp. P25]|nr:hypothetical protein LJK87_11065 [Paenibacillus sp. P25]
MVHPSVSVPELRPSGTQARGLTTRRAAPQREPGEARKGKKAVSIVAGSRTAAAFAKPAAPQPPVLTRLSQGILRPLISRHRAPGSAQPSEAAVQSALKAPRTPHTTSGIQPSALTPLALQTRAVRPPASQNAGTGASITTPRSPFSTTRSEIEYHKKQKTDPGALVKQASAQAVSQVSTQLEAMKIQLAQDARSSLPDLERFVDKVYKELEKKIRFERRRSGL